MFKHKLVQWYTSTRNFVLTWRNKINDKDVSNCFCSRFQLKYYVEIFNRSINHLINLNDQD